MSYRLIGDAGSGGPVVTAAAALPLNEPAGYAPIVRRQFNTKAANGGDRGAGAFPDKVGGSEGWDGVEWDQAKIVIPHVQPGGPYSPTNTARFEFTAGVYSGGITYQPGNIQTQGFTTAVHGNQTRRELYTRCGFLLGTDFLNHPTGVKMFFHRTNEPNGKFEPIMSISAGGPPYQLHINVQGSEDNARDFGLGPNGQIPTLFNANLVTGVWYELETQLIMNSAFGVADGTVRAWLNRVKIIERTDVRLLRNATPGFYWDNITGFWVWGGQNGTIPVTFYTYLDDFYVSGKN